MCVNLLAPSGAKIAGNVVKLIGCVSKGCPAADVIRFALGCLCWSRRLRRKPCGGLRAPHFLLYRPCILLNQRARLVFEGVRSGPKRSEISALNCSMVVGSVRERRNSSSSGSFSIRDFLEFRGVITQTPPFRGFDLCNIRHVARCKAFNTLFGRSLTSL